MPSMSERTFNLIAQVRDILREYDPNFESCSLDEVTLRIGALALNPNSNPVVLLGIPNTLVASHNYQQT